jgi:hypothetical protein
VRRGEGCLVVVIVGGGGEKGMAVAPLPTRRIRRPSTPSPPLLTAAGTCSWRAERERERGEERKRERGE